LSDLIPITSVKSLHSFAIQFLNQFGNDSYQFLIFCHISDCIAQDISGDNAQIDHQAVAVNQSQIGFKGEVKTPAAVLVIPLTNC
jgi:predicted ATPase